MCLFSSTNLYIHCPFSGSVIYIQWKTISDGAFKSICPGCHFAAVQSTSVLHTERELRHSRTRYGWDWLSNYRYGPPYCTAPDWRVIYQLLERMEMQLLYADWCVPRSDWLVLSVWIIWLIRGLGRIPVRSSRQISCPFCISNLLIIFIITCQMLMTVRFVEQGTIASLLLPEWREFRKNSVVTLTVSKKAMLFKEVLRTISITY